MVLLPLFERRYRVASGMKDSDKFGSGHAMFTELANVFPGVASTDAEQLWHLVRHGLLHRAMPKASAQFRIVLTRKPCGAGIRVEDGTGNLRLLWVNPLALRDTLLSVLEADSAMWSDPKYPLAEEFQFAVAE